MAKMSMMPVQHVFSVLPAGLVSWEVHRYGLLAAVLQAHPEQALGSERPGVHRPGVLQLAHLDQVSFPALLNASIFITNKNNALKSYRSVRGTMVL